ETEKPGESGSSGLRVWLIWVSWDVRRPCSHAGKRNSSRFLSHRVVLREREGRGSVAHLLRAIRAPLQGREQAWKVTSWPRRFATTTIVSLPFTTPCGETTFTTATGRTTNHPRPRNCNWSPGWPNEQASRAARGSSMSA